MGQSHGLAAVDLAPMKEKGRRLGNLEVRTHAESESDACSCLLYVFFYATAQLFILTHILLSDRCLVLSCLVLSCLVLSCLVLSCLVLSCLVLSCLVLSCLVLPCLALSCLAFSCLVLPFLALSCLVLSSLTLPCFALTYLTLPSTFLFPHPSSYPYPYHHVPQALEPHLGFGRPMIGESKPLSNSSMVRTTSTCTYDPYLLHHSLSRHFDIIFYSFV